MAIFLAQLLDRDFAKIALESTKLRKEDKLHKLFFDFPKGPVCYQWPTDLEKSSLVGRGFLYFICVSD